MYYIFENIIKTVAAATNENQSERLDVYCKAIKELLDYAVAAENGECGYSMGDMKDINLAISRVDALMPREDRIMRELSDAGCGVSYIQSGEYILSMYLSMKGEEELPF